MIREDPAVTSVSYALGVDVGGTKTICILADRGGQVVARSKFFSNVSGVSPMENVSNGVRSFLDENGVSPDQLIGAAVGLPGNLDAKTGELVNAPGFSTGNADIRSFFQERWRTSVVLDNDVNMAVLGEWWKGQAAGHKNVVFVAIGTGIGAGLLLEGKVYRGARGYAGEIGRFGMDPLLIPPDAARMEEFGPFERVASGTGIEQLALLHRDDFPGTTVDFSQLSAEQVFRAARQDDALAGHVMGLVVRYISFSLANVIALLNPDIVIIGGGVARQGEDFLFRIRNEIRQRIPFSFHIAGSVLGEDAGAVGAAATAWLEGGVNL